MSTKTPSHSASVFNPPLPKRPGDKIRWGQLPGSAAAAAIAQAGNIIDGVSLVVASSTAEAERLETDIKLYLGKQRELEVLRFADWETLPYDAFSPHQDITSERMRTLYQLGQGGKRLVIATVTTLMQTIAPKSYILHNSLVVAIGDSINLQAFRSRLQEAGYQSVDTVFEHGEYALRGSILDIYPMGSPKAYRIELFDDEVESLRSFDPETQRTVEQVNQIELLPAKECPLDKPSVTRFKNRWYETFGGDPKACSVYQDVDSGLSPAGVEYYLPLFFEERASIFDYLPSDTTTFVLGDLGDAIEKFWREANNRYQSRSGDRLRPVLPPAQLFLAVNDFHSQLKPFARVNITSAALEDDNKAGNNNFACSNPPDLTIDAKASNPLSRLEEYLCRHEHRILFCCESSGRKEILLEQLEKIGTTPTLVSDIKAFLNSDSNHCITVAPLDAGLVEHSSKITLIVEPQLYGMHVRQSRRRKSGHSAEQENIIKNLTELKMGAPVVHIDHGVGRYQGLQSITVEDQEQEYLVLVYADDAKLYVPVASLHLISRYSGSDEEHAPHHKLGNEQWAKAKKKAAEQIRDVAAELLEIYAKRESRRGYAYLGVDEAYRAFSESFPFEETPDQQAAIEAVRSDMLSPQPMDRLVCGDVGFGKTEVAMRAAFIAVQNSKQVVVLVPTTLLAQQHYENFKDRFADWPVNTEVISRFKSTKEVESVEKKVLSGNIDILIGTHRLLSGKVKFKNLGLLIIDEEHRFGVRQKEAIKALRAEVDILTMTATPIPRTLNMAMNGIRDLSIIATPPARRLSVKTFVREYDKATAKEAIMREILRGGQVYYLHNEVANIEKTARELGELIPEARIRIGHGQMRERELENVMSDFYHKRFNVLVCTTIIETGIDVPSANTIIIDRADKFGLAQLHQLRGRVGRSHHQAYAYLMTANAKVMTPDAHKRLAAISEAQDLGAGFMLASHDLEIRGAGELLGEEQSGQMQAIGFSLYMDMLDRAVKAIKNGQVVDLEKPEDLAADINLRIPALIPESYLHDVHTRLILYKRIANARSEEDLEDIQIEMIDRFGLLPEATKNLFRITRLKLFTESLRISKVEANNEFGRIEFAEDTKVEPLAIVNLVQSQPHKYRLDGATHLRFFANMETPDSRIKQTHDALQALSQA